MGSRAIDAYVVGSSTNSGVDGFRRHLNVRSLPATSAAFSLSLHRETPHHGLDARSGLRMVGRFARNGSAPIIATFHRAADADRPPPWLEERITAAILVSESQRAAFRDRFPAERTFVIPYGVDTTRFVPAGAPPTAVRVALPSTGCDEALLRRVTSHVDAHRRDAVFTRIKGDSATRATAFRSSTLALFPFARVVASRSLLEAMATGLPIVATDTGAVREYVDRAAILVPPDDPARLGDAVVRVLGDPELAAELGRRARARALDFDLGRVVARHRAIYRWCRRASNGAGTSDDPK